MLILVFPWLLVALVLLVVFLLLKKKWVLATFVVLAIFVINEWSDCFCFGHKTDFTGDIKVLSFNVNGEDKYNEGKLNEILSLIEEEKPGILFLTENFNPLGDSLHARLRSIYPYDMRGMPHNIIYSRYEIKEKKYSERINDGSSFIVRCVISIKNQDVVVVGCHLSSNNYSSTLDYLTPGDINSFTELHTYLTNTSRAYQLRALEADTIVGSISENDCVIVMGDMNDICGSACMQKFNDAGLRDAWSEGGFGYGATIHHPLPYRIDHILYNGRLKLKGIKKINTSHISDHDASFAVFDL